MVDPRKLSKPQNVNEVIFDASVSHSIGLTRLAGGIRNKVIAQLNQSMEQVVERLRARLARIEAEGFDRGPIVTKQLTELLESLKKVQLDAYLAAGNTLTDELIELAQYEIDFNKAVIEKAMPVMVNFSVPSATALASVVTTEPIYGKLMSEWVEGLSSSQLDRIRQVVRSGVVEGRTTDEMIRQVRGTRAARYNDGILDISRRHVATWVQTSVNHVATGARELFYKDNTDFIKGVVWVATLDSRTTHICRSRDGKVYPVGEGPRPPAHPNCRSTTSPVLRSAADMGLSMEQLPAGQRASVNGQVPGDITYGEWLKRQPDSLIDEALGPTRAKLFKEGNLDIGAFGDDKGNVYTLEVLKQRETQAFKKAGLL